MNIETINSILSAAFISSIVGFAFWLIQRLLKQKDDLQKEKVERLESQQFVQSDDVKELTITIRELTTQFKMSNDYQKNFNESVLEKQKRQDVFNIKIEKRVTNLEASDEK